MFKQVQVLHRFKFAVVTGECSPPVEICCSKIDSMRCESIVATAIYKEINVQSSSACPGMEAAAKAVKATAAVTQRPSSIAVTESQDEREARWETARKKYAALSPDVMVARNKARRERQGGPPLYKRPLTCCLHSSSRNARRCWFSRRLRLTNFSIPSFFAADQGKVLSIQIQFVQPGRRAILDESGDTIWRRKLEDFETECGLSEVCQIRFTHWQSVSTGHAHLLESHAQRYMIQLTSYDPDGVIYQFYSVAAVSTKGISVLSVGNIIHGAPRVPRCGLRTRDSCPRSVLGNHAPTRCSGSTP